MADPVVSPDQSTTIADFVPVLSFPAILRNPGLTNRYAHLRMHSQAPSSHTATVKKRHRDENEGKRWVRRKDNARFVDNPHIVPATRQDYALSQPSIASTFPEPLPSYLPRTVKLAPVAPPISDPVSSNAGRFSLSLRGMRRELRRAGGRAQVLVKDVENELSEWLRNGGTILRPEENINPETQADVEGTPLGVTGTIIEVSRTPLQLIWRIPDDSFARYVVHCCARYHEVVSFSKGEANDRLTYLLRPNVTRPDHLARSQMETPPVTDIDRLSAYSTTDIDSDFVSDRELNEVADSDGDEAASLAGAEGLSISSLPHISELDSDDAWSILGGSDAEREQDASHEIASRLTEIHIFNVPAISNPQANVLDIPREQTVTTVENNEDKDRTFRSASQIYELGQSPKPARRRNQLRSTSSPSRSPARTRRRTAVLGKRKPATVFVNRERLSFYEYLFL